MQKVAILGASRGLGRALAEEILNQYPDCKFLLIARNMSAFPEDNVDRWVRMDLATADGQACACQEFLVFKPTHIFYVAGGGPFGRFDSKDLKSHMWATELNYLGVMRILHFVMTSKDALSPLKQFAVVGSAIAGAQPDPMAASYSGAKHALRGLIGSIAIEKPWFDLKLYEPGYMDTDMLPANSWPRSQGMAADPRLEAKRMLRFVQSSERWLDATAL